MPGAQEDQKHEAATALGLLLDAAAGSLSGFEQPVVVAACPNKHDDAGRYPDWLGVQVGRATWERSDYRFEGGDLLEEARNPDELVAAREVLSQLQNSQWRLLFERATGHKLSDQVLAIVIQHGARWFVVSPSNDGMDHAYLIGASGALSLIGEGERLDQRLGQRRPLLLERIAAEAWPTLQAAVPAFPIEVMPRSEQVNWQEAYAHLVELVRNALFWARSLPGVLRYVATSQNEPGGEEWGFMPGGWRSIAIDGKWATRQRFDQPAAYADRVNELGISFQLLDGIVNLLENAEWRDLFTRTIMPLVRSDTLALMVRGNEGWLIAAQTAVFALTSEGELRLVGACDRIAWGHDAGGVTIHLFEGRSVTPPEMPGRLEQV